MTQITMKKIAKIVSTTLLLAGLFPSLPVQAQQIGLGSFGVGSTTQDYDGLGLSFENSTPLGIDGFTYTTDDSFLRYETTWANLMGLPTGGAVGSDTDTGFININFNGSVEQAGIDVGVDGAWTATVDFYNGATLLGGVALAGNGYDHGFAGWQNASGITSMQINDTDANGLVILATDLITNGTVSSVPDSSNTLLLLGFGVSSFLFAGRKLRHA
jgi:hypothetical protein